MDYQELAMTAARASVIYFFLLVLIRMLGKRTVGNFTAFDLIVALILGELVDGPIYGDVPLIQGLVALVVISGWAYLDEHLSYRFSVIDRLTGGSPTVLVRDGEIDWKGMAEERINEEELWSLLRLQQIEKLEDVKQATLETNGELSVIKTEEAKELEKGDLQRLKQVAQGQKAA
jgi:uncharacterized membrane protein YcaP (DUF421 family)